MKKLTLGLAVLFSGVTMNSFASLPNSGPRNGVYVPKFCGGLTFGLTGLYWSPSTTELDNALSFEGRDFTLTNNGLFRDVDIDYDWGFKANIGYVFPCNGNDITVSWAQFDHADTNFVKNRGLLIPSLSNELFTTDISIVVPLNFTGTTATPGEIFTASTTFPFTFTITPVDLDLASGNQVFKNDAVDLEFGQWIHAGCNFHLRWYGGLRFAQVEHNLDTTYVSGDVTDNRIFTSTLILTGATSTAAVHVTLSLDFLTHLREIVNQKSDFQGIGPRIGADASYHLCGGFGIVAGISTSLLVGEIDSKLFERFQADTTATISSGFFTNLGDPEITALFVNGIPIIPFLPLADLPGKTFTNIQTSSVSFKHPDETRIVPNIDIRFGADYSYAFCNPSHSKITVEVGWMLSHYFNAIDRLSQVEAEAPGDRTRHTIDASFEGPYVGVQVNI